MGTPTGKQVSVTVSTIEALRIDTRLLKDGTAFAAILWHGLDDQGNEVIAPSRYDLPTKDAAAFLSQPITLASAEAIVVSAVNIGPIPVNVAASAAVAADPAVQPSPPIRGTIASRILASARKASV